MTVLQVTAGRALLVAPGVPLLWSALPSGSGGGTGGVGLAAVSGLAGWWDASVLSGMLGSSGSAVAGWIAGLNAVSSVADKSGNGVALVPFFGAGSGTLPSATPRLSGTLGGVGTNTFPASSVSSTNLPPSGQYLPILDPDLGFRLPGATFGTASGWTVFLVWSRPNWRQGVSSSQSTLVAIGSTPLVQIDGAAGSGRLLVFPGSGQTVAAGAALERRHTHALVVSYVPGSGLSVWRNGALVASGVANTLGSAGLLTLLHDTTANGSAQCWLHEAAYWGRGLSSGEVATVSGYAARWALGARRGINLLVNAQSNGVNGFNAGGWHRMAQGIAWYLGALAYNVPDGLYATLIGALGLYQATGDIYSGTFLNDPNDGSSPSTWALGAQGLLAQSFVTGLPAAELSDVAAIFWPWTESDSGKSYAEKATYEAAQLRYLGMMRSWVGKAAGALPLLLWNALPFGGGSDGGMQMCREAAYDLTQASTQNAVIVLPNTAGHVPLNNTNYNATTGGTTDGAAYNGDYNHANNTTLYSYAVLAVPAAAAAILAAGGGDTVSAIPAGVPAVGGPVVRHVYQQSGTQYVVTVTHDAGTDLIVPLQAANGYGWVMMDGGSVASPGALIYAVSCARLNATQLLVTLASAPAHAAGSLLLFYPYGAPHTNAGTPFGEIGLGNVVTDNLSTLAAPAGWDIGGQLGSGWYQNLPLAATTYGLAVSTSPT